MTTLQKRKEPFPVLIRPDRGDFIIATDEALIMVCETGSSFVLCAMDDFERFMSACKKAKEILDEKP